MTQIVPLSDARRRQGLVYFARAELALLLALYYRGVALGEWRDYALDHDLGIAVFSVFRRSRDRPALSVAKRIGPRGPEYAAVDGFGRTTRGAALDEVLPAIRPRLRVIVAQAEPAT